MLLTHLPTVLEGSIRGKVSVKAVGPAGCGKTSLMRDVAESYGKKIGRPFACRLLTVPTMDAPDVKGYFVVNDDRTKASFTRPHFFPIPGEDPEDGVIILDEFELGEPIVKKAFASIILEHGTDDYKLPEGWTVWLTSNRVEDKAGVTRALMHLNNRHCILPVEPDPIGWRVWAESANVHPTIIAFATRFPHLVFEDTPPKGTGAFCSPRSVVLMGQHLAELYPDSTSGAALPHDAIASEVAAGWVGMGVATEFMTFAKLSNEVPDFEDILKDPASFRIPNDAGVKFILVQYCASLTDTKNIGSVMTYIDRMPMEYQVAFIKSIMSRDRELRMTKAFGAWSRKNGALITSVYS